MYASGYMASLKQQTGGGSQTALAGIRFLLEQGGPGEARQRAEEEGVADDQEVCVYNCEIKITGPRKKGISVPGPNLESPGISCLRSGGRDLAASAAYPRSFGDKVVELHLAAHRDIGVP